MNAPFRLDCGNVRVMTWNIHGGGATRHQRDLRPIVRLVKRHGPDIVALQEVDSRPLVTRRAKIPSSPAFEFLAGALGTHAADVRLVTAPDGEYGHAVFSRWPMGSTRRHDVSLEGYQPRAAIETTVETPFGPLHVVAAHLGLSFKERRHQAGRLVEVVRNAASQSVVLGDFNDWVWRGSVQRALAACMQDRTHQKTFPALLPVFALDRVYCRPKGMLVRSWTDLSARESSDHLPVIAQLAVGVGAAQVA